MLKHAQSGRMEEQRCSLQPSQSNPVSPTYNGNALNYVSIGQKPPDVPNMRLLFPIVLEIILNFLQQMNKRMHSGRRLLLENQMINTLIILPQHTKVKSLKQKIKLETQRLTSL